MKAIILIAALAVLHATTSGAQVVQVTGGSIRGAHDGTAFYFKGVPFAAPPVGKLRFVDPQPLQSWQGVRDTVQFSAGCMQQCALPRPALTCPATMSEDCLYLNVFTPTLNTTALLPVLVFIHGGAFIAGAAGTTLYESSGLAAREDMVVVTGNYRLGVFGALYNEQIPGNFNIKDQRAVLQWVQDNIAQFGGDRGRVTLAGQSAGAMSVGCHLASPLSQPLFQAAAMSSNPFGLLMAAPNLATDVATDLATKLGCPASFNLACMQAVDANTMLNVSSGVRPFPYPSTALSIILPWIPTVTGDEQLAVQPLFAADNASGVFPAGMNLLQGTMANDSLLFIYEAISFKMSGLEIDALVAYVLGLSATDEIVEAYGPVPAGEDARLYLATVLTDYLFYCPNRYYARAVAQNKRSTVHRWLLSQLPSFSTWIWGGSDTPICDGFVCHSDDLPFLFDPLPFIPGGPQPTPQEVTMMNFIQDSYGAFVRSMGSTVGVQAQQPAWPPAFAAGLGDLLMNFLAPNSTIADNHRGSFCDLWDTIGYNRY